LTVGAKVASKVEERTVSISEQGKSENRAFERAERTREQTEKASNPEKRTRLNKRAAKAREQHL